MTKQEPHQHSSGATFDFLKERCSFFGWQMYVTLNV